MYTIIFDWKRTLYDPDSKKLITGTLKILKFLNLKLANVILIGKGSDEMHNEVKRLKIKKYFSKIIFQEGKKDIKVFSEFVSIKNPKSTIIVGDRVQSEIEIGNMLDATTIWLKQGKFSEESPLNKIQEPIFTFNSLTDLLDFFTLKFNQQILA